MSTNHCWFKRRQKSLEPYCPVWTAIVFTITRGRCALNNDPYGFQSVMLAEDCASESDGDVQANLCSGFIASARLLDRPRCGLRGIAFSLLWDPRTRGGCVTLGLAHGSSPQLHDSLKYFDPHEPNVDPGLSGTRANSFAVRCHGLTSEEGEFDMLESGNCIGQFDAVLGDRVEISLNAEDKVQYKVNSKVTYVSQCSFAWCQGEDRL
eukprot:12431475-Karenia_brevis.AAC.2